MRTSLLLLAIGLPVCLAAQRPSLAGMPFKGELLHQERFHDNSGENVILVSSIDYPKEQRNDLFAYHYRIAGAKPTLVWDIQDFSTPLCNLAVADGGIQVIDLDQDGVSEVSVLYQQRCDGLDPYVTKLILHSNGKKYAIRGLFAVEDGSEIEKKPDPANAGAAPAMRTFMEATWAEFARKQVVISEPFMYEVVGEGSRVLKVEELDGGSNHYHVLTLELLDAGGGLTYDIENATGGTNGIDAELLAALQRSDAITMTKDKGTLIYASVSKGIGAFEAATKVKTSFMTFFTDTEQLSELAWSPDGKQLAFIALNTAQYPQRTRVFVLTIEGGKMTRKDKYDVPCAYMAAADWSIEPLKWIDGKTLEYKEFGEGPDYTTARLKLNP